MQEPLPIDPRDEARINGVDTERELLRRLRARHGRTSANGGVIAAKHVFAPHVRSAAGFDARRTIDAIAVSTWPSTGLLIDGFEVKCSRQDWRNELRHPEKAAEFYPFIDRMWLVAAHRQVFEGLAPPPFWGIMVPHGAGLTVVRQPAYLHGIAHPQGYAANTAPLPPGFNRGFLVALLRQVARGA